MTMFHRIGLCSVLAGTLSSVWAAPASANTDMRVASFDAADRARAPRPGGVVFVVRSSIRFWNDLETDFRPCLSSTNAVLAARAYWIARNTPSA